MVVRFLHEENNSALELSLDDVFLVPQYFDGESRLAVDLRPSDLAGGSHPIVSSNMNAVTGKRMAETIARCGGLGVLPQDMDSQSMCRIIEHIQAADPRYDTPLTVTPNASLRDVLGIIWKRAHHMVVVVDEDHRPIGLVTLADVKDRDQHSRVSDVMSRDVVSIERGMNNRDAFVLMEQHRLKAVPVLEDSGKLCGVLTRDESVRLEVLKPSLDGKGRLMVAAALGISSDVVDRARLLTEMGVAALVLDTAHGHQRRMLEAVTAVRQAVGKDMPIVAGNVCTAEGTRALIEAGADVVKVNVGPGAMCTTRMQTGSGRPTFSSVRECANEARKHGKHVWGDGGVRYPRDVALYVAAGASRVMIGTMLAGTYESPGDIHEDRDGKLFKQNYGMASARAVSERTQDLDQFDRAKKAYFREGVSSSKVYIQEHRESVGAILIDMISGLQSAFTYSGASNAKEFSEKAIVGVQTSSGFFEGTAKTLVNRQG